MQTEQITEDQYIDMMESSTFVDHLDLGTTILTKIISDEREMVLISTASGTYARVYH